MRYFGWFGLVCVVLAPLSCSKVLGYDDVKFRTPWENSGGGGYDDQRDAEQSDVDQVGEAQASGAGGSDTGDNGCKLSEFAYIHGDLWAFWHNSRVACDAQHRWGWLCRKYVDEGLLSSEYANCSVEAQWYSDCTVSQGAFPETSWDTGVASPSSPDERVCQPQQGEIAQEAQRPNNPNPCDTTSFDFDKLRMTDPFYGFDGPLEENELISMRHLTIQVFEAGVDPLATQDRPEPLISFSTHPDNPLARSGGVINHRHPDSKTRGICYDDGAFDGSIPAESSDPFPANSIGPFFWMEVPGDVNVVLFASWIGDDVPSNVCKLKKDDDTANVYSFPKSFEEKSVAGKPWLISNPCYDVVSVQLKKGRHYLWNHAGVRELEGCEPPKELLNLVPDARRETFRSDSCLTLWDE